MEKHWLEDHHEKEAEFLDRQDREARIEWANAHAAAVRTEKIGQHGWTATNKEIQDRARLRGAVDTKADAIDRKRRADTLPGIKNFHEREYLNGRISNDTRYEAHGRMWREEEDRGR